MKGEREILFTGIGGQGVQLAAQILARACIHQGHDVLLLGSYGGTMRGGPTEATLVVGEGPLVSPPLVSEAAACVAMHHAFADRMLSKLRPGALVVRNTSLFEGDDGLDGFCVVDVPATAKATEAGSPMAASLVLAGALASATGLVEADGLVAGMRASVPAYRAQHLEANERALRVGFAHLSDPAADWRAA